MIKRKLAMLSIFITLLATFSMIFPLVAQAAIAGPLWEPWNWYNSQMWSIPDGFSNNAPFNTGWRNDHVHFNNGVMTLQLDNNPCWQNWSWCSGKPYASGEVQSNYNYNYGLFQTSMQPAKASGIVTSFFTYTGPAFGTQWDEIDIEFLGKDTTKVQFNYFTNGVGGHEYVYNLGFDAAYGYHTYGFRWGNGYITWYVDGRAVHTENGSRGPIPTTPGHIMMNLWPGTGVDGWLGSYNYNGPLYANYDWVQYQY